MRALYGRDQRRRQRRRCARALLRTPSSGYRIASRTGGAHLRVDPIPPNTHCAAGTPTLPPPRRWLDTPSVIAPAAAVRAVYVRRTVVSPPQPEPPSAVQCRAYPFVIRPRISADRYIRHRLPRSDHSPASPDPETRSSPIATDPQRSLDVFFSGYPNFSGVN